jgi:hypothetical protein
MLFYYFIGWPKSGKVPFAIKDIARGELHIKQLCRNQAYPLDDLQGAIKLALRNRGLAQYTPEQFVPFEGWQAYYLFVLRMT